MNAIRTYRNLGFSNMQDLRCQVVYFCPVLIAKNVSNEDAGVPR